MFKVIQYIYDIIQNKINWNFNMLKGNNSRMEIEIITKIKLDVYFAILSNNFIP